MVRDKRRLTIPNPHPGDISLSLIRRILNQTGITPDEWDRLA
jgi:hypothetical protein